MTQIDLLIYAGGAVVLTGWIAIVAVAALRGWSGWLSLRHAELELSLQAGRQADQAPALPAMTRIDVADLKERVRKLEAIAAGVDL